MVYFIGVEVGVALNLYFQIRHELGKVNDLKFYLEGNLYFKDIYLGLTFVCLVVERSGSISLSIDVHHFHYVLPMPHTMICIITTMKYLSFKK